MMTSVTSTTGTFVSRKLSRSRFGLSLTVFVLSVMALCVSVSAEQYVSFGGKFHITIPDHWQRADYRTVDYYLSQVTDDPQALDYEALFTPAKGGRFADDAYLLLTIDTVGELSQSEIDSVLQIVTETFGEGLEQAPTNDYLTSMIANEPVYDRQNKTVAILTEILEEDKPFKKSLLVMKFYERGIANFYFYAPDTLYDINQPLFASIVSSFSTENLEAALPDEDLTVADLKSEEGAGSRYLPTISAAVIIVLLIAIIARRRRARSSSGVK